MTLRPLAAAVLLFALAGPATAQTNPYTWNAATGSWNLDTNWLNGNSLAEVPPSNAATQLVFNASGTTTYTATNDIGAGTFLLNRLTVNNTGTGNVAIAAATTSNTLTMSGSDPTLDITGNVVFTGRFANSTSMIKTGTGTFIHDSNNTAFTGTLTINGGTFVNRATVTATTNFNPVSIVVNNGGTYQFGENTTGDPNLPNSTYVTVNSGGTVNWQEGETFGGFHLQGGTINLQQGSSTNSGTTAQTWTSGTLTGGAFAVGGATAINKTTSGTVVITGGASVTTTTGGFNIQDGTVSHAAVVNLGTSNITLGSTDGSTAGTFEYQGATASRAGTFAANAGGGTVAVTNPAAALTLSGNFSGAGALAKTGAGTLHLTGTLGQTGTTTAAAGTLPG